MTHTTPIPPAPEILARILDTLPVIVLVLDSRSRVVLANQCAAEITQTQPDQLVGLSGGRALGCQNHCTGEDNCGIGTHCPTCPLHRAMSQTRLEKKAQKWIEAPMALKHKGMRDLRISTTPLEAGEDCWVMVTIEDFTELKRLEEHQVEREKLAAVLETAGAVCHELSQPLQIVTGFCDILMEHKELDPETCKALDAIQKAVQKMAQLNFDLMHITGYKTKAYLSATIIDIEKSSAGS
ncbi:MAG: hypothetical protein MI747_00845 [Desulfobacterales bacterium]|nr:hypothetical protein [Desulfobacterales bacterium]